MNGTTGKRSPGRKGTPPAEPKSKLPRSASDVLRKHVTLEVECIDRMYLNAIVPRLQITEGAVSYIRHQKRAQVASSNAVEPMTRTCPRGAPAPSRSKRRRSSRSTRR